MPLANGANHRISKTSLAYYMYLIDHCLSQKSLNLTTIVHARLIKVAFNRCTFLGNHCLNLYSQFGSANDVLRVFGDITQRNTVSWNICLKGLLKFGHFGLAQSMFDTIPERDIVSWNTMISGYTSHGYCDYALKIFSEMQNLGMRPSGFTYSLLVSIASSACHGKELHGSIIRRGLSSSNLVLGNSLIDMYGKLGIVYYALGVFLTMEELDVISWNSLIIGCCKAGYGELALNQFYLMRSSGFSPDEFTYSAAITSCSELLNLDKGKQMFTLCMKTGFLCNTIISGATIDLFSKCNRLEDSIRLFEELDQFDSALCNSMLSSFVRYGYGENALQLFVLTLREDIRPSEFTLSCILNSISSHPVEQGTQIHSLVVKSGLEFDAIVATSLVDMYGKFGFIDDAKKIFSKMIVRDLISWNSMINGLSHNGRVFEALGTFKELIRTGPPPDRITLSGVLLACNYGGFLDQGLIIFSSMEESYGVTPSIEHYTCLVELLCRVGKHDDAITISEAMPSEPSSLIWESILRACATYGDLKLTERIAERLIELEPKLSLPYLVLTRIYEMKGQWESIVRVGKTMERKGVKEMIGCSWIGTKNHVCTFRADQIQQPGGKDVYPVLRLLNWEMEGDGYSK